MDLSKLPKLSNTDKPPEEENPPPESERAQAVARMAMGYRLDEPLPGLAEAWISIALGLILLFCFPNTISYLRAPSAFEQANPILDGDGNPILNKQGQPMHYWQSAPFWADLGITAFASVLVVEGILLAFTKKSRLILLAFGLTVAAGMLNLFVVIHTYNIILFPTFCALAVAVSGYMAMTQWRLIQMLRARGK
jgi:hypothetical protein